MATNYLPDENVPESKYSGKYLDRKVSEIVTALLNDMTVLVDNADTEDVTLPELMDRLYNRVMTNDAKITQVIENGESISDYIVFCKALSDFPPTSEAKENVLYIDKSSGTIYQYDYLSSSYTPFNNGNVELSTSEIQKYIQVINGGNASE